MKGISEDTLIKWVHMLIKTEETWHRTASLASLLVMCKTELDFIHAELWLRNDLV